MTQNTSTAASTMSPLFQAKYIKRINSSVVSLRAPLASGSLAGTMTAPTNHILARVQLQNLCDQLSLNNGVLGLVSRDSVIVIGKVGAIHLAEKVFVMGNHDELEVGLLLSFPDYVTKRLCQAFDVLAVEIGRWFIQSDESAIRTEAFCEGQSDDDAGENLLSSTASASHVHFNIALDHDNTIIV